VRLIRKDRRKIEGTGRPVIRLKQVLDDLKEEKIPETERGSKTTLWRNE
jgi:hypothetical protein